MRSPETSPHTDQAMVESETRETTEEILQRVLSDRDSTPESVLESLDLDPNDDKNTYFKLMVTERLKWLSQSRENGIGAEIKKRDVDDAAEEIRLWYEQLKRTAE